MDRFLFVLVALCLLVMAISQCNSHPIRKEDYFDDDDLSFMDYLVNNDDPRLSYNFMYKRSSNHFS